MVQDKQFFRRSVVLTIWGIDNEIPGAWALGSVPAAASASSDMHGVTLG